MNQKYFGLTPTQLNLAFFAVVSAVAAAGFVYLGGVGALREYLGKDEPTTRPAVQATGTAEPTAEPNAPAPEAEAPASVAAPAEFGPDVVWITLVDTGDALWNALRDGDNDDVVEVMLRYGASAQAVEFFRETGLFATSFKETGKVDVVETTLPGRANSLNDTVLVNGSPRTVVAETAIGEIPIEDYSPYTEIAAAIDTTAAAYQDESLRFIPWAPDVGLLEITASPTGGQSFLFSLPLTDGCHACGFGYEGHVALDFGPDGTYEGWRVLEPCAMLGMETYVDVGAELCERQTCVPPAQGCWVWVQGDLYDTPGGRVVHHWDSETVVKVEGVEGRDWWLIGGEGPPVWVTDARPVEVGELPCVTGTLACLPY